MFIELHKKTKKNRILSDAAVVTEHAQHLIEFSEGTFIHKENPQGKLGVIAIVGKAFSPIHGEFERALLCEIGMGRVRPYGIAELPKNNTLDYHAKTIKARKQLFSLSRKQYEMVAPLLFSLLQKISAEKICAWQCNKNPFWIKTTNNRWLKGRKTLVQRTPWRVKINGTRFSISANELFLCEDVHWAELYGNTKLIHQLEGFTRHLFFPLNHYIRLRTKKALSKLPKYSFIQEIYETSPFPNYLKIHALQLHLPPHIRNYFWDDLLQLFAWDGAKLLEERHAIRALPNPPGRLRQLELRLTHDHANSSIKVFEVYPSDAYLSVAEKATVSANADINSEDLPF